MTYAWFIDTVDARAGLAFTSLRGPDLLTQDPTLDLPGVFIAPPTFRPETVSSRALAFAATRGPFQCGLFIAEREVAFPRSTRSSSSSAGHICAEAGEMPPAAAKGGSRRGRRRASSARKASSYPL